MGTSYTGDTNVTAGTILVEGTGGSFLGPNTLVTIAAGAVFDFNNNPEDFGSVQGAGELRTGNLTSGFARVGQDNRSVTWTGNISGAGGVFKAGTGVWTVAGANTYTGNTTVEAGTLALANNGTTTAGSIAASPNIIVGTAAGSTAVFDVTQVTTAPHGFRLAPGQTLGGHGTVAGNVTVGSTSTVAPGTSVGVLTQAAGGTMYWEPAGRLLLEYSSLSSPVAGTDNDLVNGPSATLDLSALSAGNPFTLTLTRSAARPTRARR